MQWLYMSLVKIWNYSFFFNLSHHITMKILWVVLSLNDSTTKKIASHWQIQESSLPIKNLVLFQEETAWFGTDRGPLNCDLFHSNLIWHDKVINCPYYYLCIRPRAFCPCMSSRLPGLISAWITRNSNASYMCKHTCTNFHWWKCCLFAVNAEELMLCGQRF